MKMLSERETVAALYAPMKPGAKDIIRLNAEVHLSLTERLLLLFRPLIVKARIDCEHKPGATSGVTYAFAARWTPPWKRGGVQAAASPSISESVSKE